MKLTYRWLGTAGLEFCAEGYTLLIDPFFTRPHKLALLAGWRIATDADLVARHISRADAVLVTHAHYDHIMDVPEVLRLSGARAYGSANACALLGLHGISAGQVSSIQSGDRLELGPFAVEVFPARHTELPLARLLNGPLPGRVLRRPRLPLRPHDYRMDACYSFRLTVGETRLLVGNHPIAADALFVAPYRSGLPLEEVARRVNPRLVVPIHWDDFTRPLAWPLLPMPATRAQGVGTGRMPIGRLNLAQVVQSLQAALPGVEVRVPRLFEVSEL